MCACVCVSLASVNSGSRCKLNIPHHLRQLCLVPPTSTDHTRPGSNSPGSLVIGRHHTNTACEGGIANQIMTSSICSQLRRRSSRVGGDRDWSATLGYPLGGSVCPPGARRRLREREGLRRHRLSLFVVTVRARSGGEGVCQRVDLGLGSYVYRGCSEHMTLVQHPAS